MKLIPLSQNQHAIVDDCDFERLSRFKWYAVMAKNSRFYARRKDASGKQISMQNEVLLPKEGFVVDHRERKQTLDNRGSNLRYATNSQNQANKEIQANNTSGFKGVCWNTRRQRWRVQVWLGGKAVYEKSFRDLEQAAAAYKEHSQRIYGEFSAPV